MIDYIVLVDENNRRVGIAEKSFAHKQGLLHRAFSVFVLKSDNEVLLQKRADGKYHSGGLWSNTCCSHPRSNYDYNIREEAKKRLLEEMGIECEVEKAFQFRYRKKFNNGLVENELDYVFVGISDETPNLNLNEASDYRYTHIELLRKDIAENPQNYTFWLREIFNKHYDLLLLAVSSSL